VPSARARELCAAVGDDETICLILFGVWLFEYGAANHADAAITANKTLARAERTENAGAHVLGHISVGVSSTHLGDLMGARRHFEAAIGWYHGLNEAEAHARSLGIRIRAWCTDLWFLPPGFCGCWAIPSRHCG
jgi:hypothetical protein